jgi:thioredoxin-related protein
MFGFLFAFFVSAGSRSLLLPHPTELKVNESLRLEPAVGHHFEMRARQTCAEFQFTKKTETLLECKITAAGNHKITANVCKDDKSYCKPESFTLKAVPAGGVVSPNAAKAAPSSTLASENSRSRLEIPPGFFRGSFKEALRLAKNSDRILFLNFTAGWCPPCNRNKDFLFPTTGFRRSTEKWVLFQVDVDELSSAHLKETYNIRAYPTFVALSPDSKEITRAVGEQDEEAFIKFAKEVERWRSVPIDRLTALSNKEWKKLSIEERVRLANHFINRDQYESVLWVTEKKPREELKEVHFRARLYQAIDDGRKREQRRLLESLFKNGGPTKPSATWLIHWGALDKKAASKYLSSVRSKIIEDRKIVSKTVSGKMAIADSLAREAELLAFFDQKDASTELYEKAGQAHEKILRNMPLNHRRYMTMSAGSAFAEAERWDKVIALYQPLAKKGDSDPTFMVRLAKAYFYQKNFDQALKTIDKVRPDLYGDNFLRAANFRVDVLLAMNRKTEAKDFLLQTVKEFSLPTDTAPQSTHHLYEQLKSRSAEIEKS